MEVVMKKLEICPSKPFIILLSSLFLCVFSIGDRLCAVDVEEVKTNFNTMKVSQESTSIIDEIINGEFQEDRNYLSILPSSKFQYEDYEDIDPSIIGYAYQVLGQYYMVEKKDVSKAAISYFRSLECYYFNDELIGYLRRIGVKSFTRENIETGLNKIIKR